VRNGNAEVTVIGAGVIGLTTAVCLAEAGVTVAVRAAEPPQQTTSAVAGAVWGPHLVGSDDRVKRWAGDTLAVLRELSAGMPAAAAVRVADGVAAVRAAGSGPPEFAADRASLSECAPGQVPAGYQSAWRLSAPLVSMPEYLDYLHERYVRAGGSPVAPASYPTLAEAAGRAASRVLVNCTGSGAGRLVPDPDVTPVRGQIVVAVNPGITGFFVGTGPDDGDLTYFFPHGDRIVLGGTELPGEWSRTPDQATAHRIIAACAAVEPKLAQIAVLAHRVGLRPFRPQVRLEAERTPAGQTIVHNYGHGGSGVTLSWGCARDAAKLALAALRG
jgi:D-amino-acid oxidase